MQDIRVNKKFIQTSKSIGENFTVLAISDSHFSDDNYFERLYEMIALAELIKPSIICLAGDILDTFDVVNDNPLLKEKLLYGIEKLSKSAPVFIVFAAHDNYTKAANKDFILKSWFAQLRQIKNVTIFAPQEEKQFYLSDEISVGGFSSPLDLSPAIENGSGMIEYMNPAVKRINFSETTYNIMIFHSSIFAFDKNGLRARKAIGLENVNLGLAGHCHGGLAPKFLESLNTGLITPDKHLFPHNVSGLFTSSDEDFNLLISRGIQKIPKTVIEEMGKVGELLYKLNQIYIPDVDLLTINGQPKKRIYSK